MPSFSHTQIWLCKYYHHLIQRAYEKIPTLASHCTYHTAAAFTLQCKRTIISNLISYDQSGRAHPVPSVHLWKRVWLGLETGYYVLSSLSWHQNGRSILEFRIVAIYTYKWIILHSITVFDYRLNWGTTAVWKHRPPTPHPHPRVQRNVKLIFRSTF